MAQTTLSVWRYATADGARDAGRKVRDLARTHDGAVQDAAEVWWEAGADGPRTRQVPALAGVGALGGAFWGMLFGELLFVPLLGAAVGAAAGGAAGLLADVGIDDRFVNRVRDVITPGSSALFLLSSAAAVEDVRVALAGPAGPDVVVVNLTGEQAAALRGVFGAG